MSSSQPADWWHKPLAEMSQEEWESLCDGCAKCCLYRLEDADTREIYYTNVHCRLLDSETGRCRDYAHRAARVPDCVTITFDLLQDPYWLPRTCAYRLLAEGRDLPAWHPLISGTRDSVARAGQRACRRAISEDEAGDLEDHLVDWIE